MKTFLAIFVLPLFLSACLVSPGTNTGNPGDDMHSEPGSDPAISQYLVLSVCRKIKDCYPQSNSSICYSKAMDLSGYTSELGSTAAAYNSMNDLLVDETDGKLTPNNTNSQTCMTAIEALSCSSSLVQNAYSTAAPADYSATNTLFRAATACQQIY